MSNTIDLFYTSCMNCTLNCSGVWIDIKNGIPPRGFYYQQSPIDILVVSKNPGHPLKGESQLFQGKVDQELFKAYRIFQEKLYHDLKNNKEQSTRFHKNLYRYLSYFLDIPNDLDQIYKHVAHTDLLKCSTQDEQAIITDKMFDKCYKKYFLNELELLKPKLLLVLGREVERFLQKRKHEHKIPIIYIKHPSYFYKKDLEKSILDAKKEEIQQYLAKKAYS